MFKISILNPKDKTLDEIHEIQKNIYAEDESFSSKELAERYNSSISELSKEYRINFQVISSKEAPV